MTQKRVLVEFLVDPTEWAQGVRLSPDKSLVMSTSYPDTQESAVTLVTAGLRGETDLPDYWVDSTSVCLYHCRVSVQQIGLHTAQIDAVSAILETLRQLRKQYVGVEGQVCITCNPPTEDKPFYEVSIWKKDGSPSL